MDKFKAIEIELENMYEISCSFFEHTEENILRIKISGNCPKGSRGENYGQYLYEKIGLALLKIEPNAVLVDLSNLNYEFGDRILKLFQVFSTVRIFGEEDILTAFVLSDKNKLGLSSSLQYDPDNLAPPFFNDLDLAYKNLYAAYDEI